MNCTTFQGLVHELADGLLGPDDTGSARAHAATCGACAETFDAARRFKQFLGGEGDAAIEAWTAHVATMQAASDTALAVAPRETARMRAPMFRLGPFLAVAAASALFVVAGFSLFSGREVLAEEQPTSLSPGTRVLASEGRELEAEDAARVVVPRGSAGSVVRLMTGNVLFRVEPGHVFAVETPQGTARALGTSFHVAVSPSQGVSVAVHSGSVRFAGADERETTLLGAGDRLEVDTNGVQRLINRRRLDDLQTDLAAFRESASRQRRDRESGVGLASSAPAAAPAAAPDVASGAPADSVRAFLDSDEGRALLAATIKAVQEEQVAQGAARMFDGMISRFAKDADLTEDQTKRLREIFHRTGVEFREAWAPLGGIAAGATETERDRVREEVSAKSAEIESRKDDEVRNLLSQTQYEAYRKKFALGKGGFGGGPADRGN